MDIGTMILEAYVFAIPFAAVGMIMANSLQAMGKALPAFIVSLSRQGKGPAFTAADARWASHWLAQASTPRTAKTPASRASQVGRPVSSWVAKTDVMATANKRACAISAIVETTPTTARATRKILVALPRRTRRGSIGRATQCTNPVIKHQSSHQAQIQSSAQWAARGRFLVLSRRRKTQ